ncbi:MAG TPA: hypothetical protein VGI44_10890, partial [Acidimicrobiales bacterium]
FTLREPSLEDVFLALTSRRAEVDDETQENEENGGEPDHDPKPTGTTADRRSAPMPAENNYAGGRS